MNSLLAYPGLEWRACPAEQSSILTEEASVNTAAAFGMGLVAVDVMVEEFDETAP